VTGRKVAQSSVWTEKHKKRAQPLPPLTSESLKTEERRDGAYPKVLSLQLQKSPTLNPEEKCEIFVTFQRVFFNWEYVSSNPPRSASYSNVRRVRASIARKARQWRAFAHLPSVSPPSQFGDLGGQITESLRPILEISHFERLRLEILVRSPLPPDRGRSLNERNAADIAEASGFDPH
jgi:hypothetical protein